ncbi:iron chelate uptake ABC transporter family permease subunit [Vibrio aphrogenes]|uniref:iron chelate uptake ABC transporter family permease subunit n=1 Tax=Vibrio aphrogenes TaxID=1891186 RepID=UPI000B3615F2|nr:iron chelate uptake ABC transporter family permease subunit [Vibrio aphrogenes]
MSSNIPADKYKIWALLAISLVMAALFIGYGLNANNYEYFLSRRIPKVLSMVIAGFAIGLSSFCFQTITNNRILTPSIMGFDSLYMLIQVLVVATFGGLSVMMTNAVFNFAISVVLMMAFSLVLFLLYFRYSASNIISLLLLGVIFGQLFQSGSSFLTMLMDPDEFASVQSNMFASFNNIHVELVYWTLPALVLVSVWLFKLHQTLDVYLLDQDNAISLGVDIKRTTRTILLLSAILIAISTALIGPIMFFGLLITNLTREWLRTYQHKYLLTACGLMSVATLLVGQWIIEKAFGFETTLSVIINFVGGLYFLFLLLRNKVV